MKKKSKLIVVFLCTLLLGTSFIFSRINNNKVYADDGSVTGTSNLNNTSNNSAKIGDVVKSPEIGWKRYDDRSKLLAYSGFSPVTEQHSYLTTLMGSSSAGNTVTFKFYGSKLRLLTFDYYDKSNNNTVTIDGVACDSFNCNSGNYQGQTLAYEKTDLSMDFHKVVVTAKGVIDIDAIDIDSNGYIVDSSAIQSTGISLDKTSLDMNVGDDNTLTPTIVPNNATNKTVKWTSSDSSIATVDDNGKVTAVKGGSVTITATTTDGGNQSAACTINVKNPNDGNALLTVTFTDGQERTYDITMSQFNDFITWYNNRANGQGNFTYSFSKAPGSSAYTKRTEYLIYDKISNYDVDQYKTN